MVSEDGLRDLGFASRHIALAKKTGVGVEGLTQAVVLLHKFSVVSPVSWLETSWIVDGRSVVPLDLLLQFNNEVLFPFLYADSVNVGALLDRLFPQWCSYASPVDSDWEVFVASDGRRSIRKVD